MSKFNIPGIEELSAAVEYRHDENNRDPDSVDKYLHLLNIAAEKGNRAAMGILAEHLIDGEAYLTSDRRKKIPRDPARAAEYLQKLVELGTHPRESIHEIAEPEIVLAELYQKGDGVEYDIQKAHAIYQREALHGSGSAIYRLISLYFNGSEGFPKDYAKAVYWEFRRYARHLDCFDPDNAYSLKGAKPPKHMRAALRFTKAIQWRLNGGNGTTPSTRIIITSMPIGTGPTTITPPATTGGRIPMKPCGTTRLKRLRITRHCGELRRRIYHEKENVQMP